MPASLESASAPESARAGRRPDFVVIGAMKCGTSTLHDQLGANPQLFLSDPKEPNFFSDDDVHALGLDWYEALFAAAAPDQLCGESSTHYTKLPTHPRAAERLVAALPDARLIYLVRDPVERIVSQYIHEWSRREVDGDIDRAVDEHPRFLGYSRYAGQLRPYLEACGAERILLVFFERLMADPQSELERIAAFLGVADGLRWNDEREARNASRDRMRTSPLRDALTDAPILAFLRRHFVPQALRDRIKRLWQMSERPTLSDAGRRRIEEALDPDLAELGEWLGTPLSCADFRDVATRSSGDWSASARAEFPGRG